MRVHSPQQDSKPCMDETDVQWHRSFGENRLFPDIIFFKICFDAWCQFRFFVCLFYHPRDLYICACASLLESLRSAPICHGLPSGVLPYQCFFGTPLHTIHCSHLVVNSSLLYSIDWEEFLIRGFRIRKMTRSVLLSGHLLSMLLY